MKTKMMADFDLIQAGIRNRFNHCTHALLMSHIRPDGDAIGSLIGLGLALQSSGKRVTLVLSDGLPAKYRFLKGSQLVQKSAQQNYDLTVALDCSDARRLGDTLSEIKIDINIDHHVTNENFAELNLVMPEVPATAAILAEFLPEWGFPINEDTANALLMGIVTDTIGFRTSNVTPHVLRISAQLMEMGADLPDVYTRTLVSQSYPASMLWGFALSRLERENGIIWTVMTLDDRQKAGYLGRDDADLTNLLSAIEASEISVLFNEQNNGKVKVSWRSNSEVDVSKIAQFFGGGGHPPASGAEMDGSLEEVRVKVLEKTKQFLREKYSKGVKKNE